MAAATLIAVDSSGLALRLLGADGTEAWSFTGSGCAACGIPAAGAELLADIKHQAEDAEAEVRSYQQRGWLGKSAEFSKVAETLWEHHEALLAQLAPTRLQRLRSGRRAGGSRAARGSKTEHGRLAAEGLLASQHAILDGFLTDTSELRAWVRTLRGRGELHPGEVSRGAQPASRGDLMRWCHSDSAPAECLRDFLSRLDTLVLEIQGLLAAELADVDLLASKPSHHALSRRCARAVSLEGSLPQAGCDPTPPLPLPLTQRHEIQATCYPAGGRGYVRNLDDPRRTRTWPIPLMSHTSAAHEPHLCRS